jgi:hypothetical protein
MTSSNRVHDARKKRRALIAFFGVFFKSMIGGRGQETVKDSVISSSNPLQLNARCCEGSGKRRLQQRRRFQLILLLELQLRFHIVHQ